MRRFVKTLLCPILVLEILSTIGSIRAATIWNGPLLSASNLTQPDKITPRVWITRGDVRGIYNSATESVYFDGVSPADTEWADGTTANYAALTYSDWKFWSKTIHGGPPNTVGVPAVVHLITDDIYIDIVFTSWGSRGPYSYERATPPITNNPPTVTITNPSSGTLLNAPAITEILAVATDTDGSVTNVIFYDGTNSLGFAPTSPYSIAANLAGGSHALTAIATDNLGLFATSSVVNVTLISGPPILTGSRLRTTNLQSLRLNWPGIYLNYTLQSNSGSLLNPADWSDVRGVSNNSITVPVDGAKANVFFRLIQH